MTLIRILAVIVVCTVAVLGQTNKGGISGTVTDQNGALVPGATVTITNLGTNQSQTVTITSDPQLINTESGTTTHTITERQIQDIPLNNRSVLDLAVTAPNVSGDAGSEDPEVTSGQPVPGYNLSLNGGRPGSSTILADGVNNTGVGIECA